MRASGKQVTVETNVDPSILGGVVTRIGSVVTARIVGREGDSLAALPLEQQLSPAA